MDRHPSVFERVVLLRAGYCAAMLVILAFLFLAIPVGAAGPAPGPRTVGGDGLSAGLPAGMQAAPTDDAFPSPDQVNLFFYLFTPVALLVLAALSWNWAMRIQVQRKTGELQAELDARRRTELELLKARNHLTNVIDSIPEPVFVKDRDHRWVILNDAVCRFIGHPREELIGKSDFDFFPGQEARVFHARDEVVFTTGNEDINEEFLTDASGRTHTVLTKKTLYTDSLGNPYIVGIISDITERKKFDNQMKRFSEELEQRVQDRTRQLETSNRELEAFTYTVSHDLRAPLRAIDGFSNILLTEKAVPEPDRRTLEQIRKNTQQMARLMDDLLNFSRVGRQELHREWIDPATVVTGVIGELQEERRGRDVQISVHPLPPLSADRTMLHQVYFNLLANACKFTRAREHASIEVGAFPEEDRDVYYVRDNGIGFDMQYGDQLFGVFHRLHNSSAYEGTGVGLAIVQRIVQRHGGTIWADAAEGKGATFYFTFGREPAHGA
jgi:PAS domain S-box-containing protein